MTAPQQPPPPPPTPPKKKATAGTIVAAIVIGSVLICCGGGGVVTLLGKSATTTTAPVAAPVETTTTTAVVETTTAAPPLPASSIPTAGEVLAGCTPLAKDDPAVLAIEGSLTGGATSLGEVFTAYDGLRWIGANIYAADGSKLSSADVWVVDGALPLALSGSARQYSLLLDGRDLPSNPSAGDDIGQALQDCTTAAVQQANGLP